MSRSPNRQPQDLISTEVRGGRYFFLDLKPRSSGPARVAFGGRERCDERYRIQRANYPFPTLEYVAEGEGEIAFGDGPTQPLRPGMVFAHGPGIDLRMATVRGGTMLKYFMCLTGREARAKIEKHAPVFGQTLALARHGDMRDAFDLLIREGNEHAPFTRDLCDRVGELLLLKISAVRGQRGDERQSAARERFLRCKALIDEEGERFSSLEEIARALHAEPSGLNRLFRRYQGVSPYQYLLRHKMNLAAQDLIRSGGLVKEAAARAGYADPYHFSRLFKAVHGIAPAYFLRHHGAE